MVYGMRFYTLMVVFMLKTFLSSADHQGGGFDHGLAGGPGFFQGSQSFGHGHGGGYGHQSYPHAHPKYHYGYGVKDSYKGLDFGHHETRDGYATQGGYHVLLPDGRLQTVTYHVADDHSGFVAEVTYTGVPHHPPPPVKHEAPVLHHEPVYHAPNPYHG